MLFNGGMDPNLNPDYNDQQMNQDYYQPQPNYVGYAPRNPNGKWNTLAIIGFVFTFFFGLLGGIVCIIAEQEEEEHIAADQKHKDANQATQLCAGVHFPPAFSQRVLLYLVFYQFNPIAGDNGVDVRTMRYRVFCGHRGAKIFAVKIQLFAEIQLIGVI